MSRWDYSGMGQIPDHYNDTGPGWRSLLTDLHKELIKIDPDYKLLQSKEKWGILRVYISVQGESHPVVDLTAPRLRVTGYESGSDVWERATAVVLAAEERARTVCEDCGEPGVLRTDRFWLRILCDACNEAHPPGIVPSPPVVTD